MPECVRHADLLESTRKKHKAFVCGRVVMVLFSCLLLSVRLLPDLMVKARAKLDGHLERDI